MSKDTEISINLDLRHVTQLYDFEACEYVTPVNQEYDMTRLCQPRERNDVITDKTINKRLGYMYRFLRGKGLCETDVSSALVEAESRKKALEHTTRQQNTQAFGYLGNENLSLPQRFLPVVRPGQVIRGHVIVTFKKQVKEVQKITMSLKGGARTLIRVYNGRGYHDFRGREMYVEEAKDLWNKRYGISNTTSGPLMQGQQRFSFEFTVPNDARQSVPQLVFGGANQAHIIYRLKVTIDKGCCCKCGNVVGSRPLWVVQDVDLAALPPECAAPFSTEKVFSTGLIGTAGKITCRVNMDRRGFVKGEPCRLSLEVANADKHPIDDVIAYWKLTGVYRSGTKWHDKTREFARSTVSVSGGGIAAGDVTALRLHVPMDFREVDPCLLPVSSLQACRLIDLRYSLEVTLVRRGLRRDVTVNVPVWIASRNTSTFAAHVTS